MTPVGWTPATFHSSAPEGEGFTFLTNSVSLAKKRDSYFHQVRIM